jgi:SAM-dependent methyltransferase
MTDAKKNWFSDGGAAYADFRPDYPAALAEWIASLAAHHDCAIDVGCGSGQFTIGLAQHFRSVIGIDPSESQLAHAKRHSAITYRLGRAEALPVEAESADVLTVAQAAHWLGIERFYEEARRIVKPGGILALFSYGRMEIEAPCNGRFQQFYAEEIGPYWPAERKLVDNGCRNLAFPFDEIPAPNLAIRQNWDLPALLGYIGTWSATKKALEAGKTGLLETFGRDFSEIWGDPAQSVAISWPIAIRATRI